MGRVGMSRSDDRSGIDHGRTDPFRARRGPFRGLFGGQLFGQQHGGDESFKMGTAQIPTVRIGLQEVIDFAVRGIKQTQLVRRIACGFVVLPFAL